MKLAHTDLEELIVRAQLLQQLERGAAARSADTWLEYGCWYTATAAAKVHASVPTSQHSETRTPKFKRATAAGFGADVEVAVDALYAQSVEAEHVALSEFVKQVQMRACQVAARSR
jgi:hypothetical protein